MNKFSILGLAALALTGCATNNSYIALKGEYFEPKESKSLAKNILTAGYWSTKIDDANAPDEAWSEKGFVSYGASAVAGFVMDGLFGATMLTGLNWANDSAGDLEDVNLLIWVPADHTRFEDEVYLDEVTAKAKELFLDAIRSQKNIKITKNKLLNTYHGKERGDYQLLFKSDECSVIVRQAFSRISDKNPKVNKIPNDVSPFCFMNYSAMPVRPFKPDGWYPEGITPNKEGHILVKIKMNWLYGEKIISNVPNSYTFVPSYKILKIKDAGRFYTGRGFPYMYSNGKVYLFIKPKKNAEAVLEVKELNKTNPII